jgi:hypothetical protein
MVVSNNWWHCDCVWRILSETGPEDQLRHMRRDDPPNRGSGSSGLEGRAELTHRIFHLAEAQHK